MAENLWTVREQRKLSVATLANRVGLPIGLILEYESGQRSIDPRHLSRLAKALYIEETELKLSSDPRPSAAPLLRQDPPRRVPVEPDMAPARPRDRGPRPSRTSAPPLPPAPARPSQISHLTDLGKRLGRSPEVLEAKLGKPLAELNRVEASEMLSELQIELREGAGVNRHRAYLPEAVDGFEHQYLEGVRASGAMLAFSLFDGSTLSGRVIGFGPYTITVQQADGSETTLNKLGLVSYTVPPVPDQGVSI